MAIRQKELYKGQNDIMVLTRFNFSYIVNIKFMCNYSLLASTYTNWQEVTVQV